MKSEHLVIILIVVVLLVQTLNVHAQDAALKESMERGAEIYSSECITCHMENGEGIMGAFPPLANSDFLLEDTDRAIGVILNGQSGELVVNGATYYGEMPAVDYSDKEIADIMNYILNSWGNSGEMVTPEDVLKNR